MAHSEKMVYAMYAEAKKESHDKKWEAILSTEKEKMRFEDGYVTGAFIHIERLTKEIRKLKRELRNSQKHL